VTGLFVLLRTFPFKLLSYHYNRKALAPQRPLYRVYPYCNGYGYLLRGIEPRKHLKKNYPKTTTASAAAAAAVAAAATTTTRTTKKQLI
jgi:hypothetical protein